MLNNRRKPREIKRKQQFERIIKIFWKKLKKGVAFSESLVYNNYCLVAVTKKTQTKMNKAPWSSGQDASLSRWNQGFDSPRSHWDLQILLQIFLLYRKVLKSENIGYNEWWIKNGITKERGLGSNFAMTLIMKFFVLCGLHYLTIEKILWVWLHPYPMTFRYCSNSAVFL